jgi:hypothetical protein
MEIDLHDDRLAALSRHLRRREGACPFVVRELRDAIVKLAHFSAGRDATYVVISSSSNAANVTIGYAPFVEGTTLIYDVTDEMLQGKARPFACSLPRGRHRVYALLPVQLETIHVALRERRLEVEFRDARGERIEAALPLQLTLTSASGKHRASYCCTARDGRFVRELDGFDGDERSSIAVRSLLTGRSESATLRRT